MSKPLDDITVIEVDTWMAAPSAGAILADLGAQVIKIESPAGDPLRGMSRPAKVEGPLKGYSLQFDVDNRGKQSIRLDLTQAAAPGIVHRLCATAQVFLCNLLAPRQAKYRLDPESLLAVNPRLVHATLTGYGTQGPEAWRPGYDVTAFFARSGLSDSMREGDDGLMPWPRQAQGDHTTGLALVGAILAALRQAERSGQGQVVETSLYETAVWTQASDYAVTAVDRAPVRRRRREQLLSATLNRYPCADGYWLAVNMPEPAWWPKFCQALGKPEWAEDERFKEPKQRFDRMAELLPLLDAVFMTRPRDDWGRIFDDHGLIWAPVLALHEVASDPQAEAIGLFPETGSASLGAYRTVRIPMNFRTLDIKPGAPAPAAGQHTMAVLEAAGYSQEELATLAKTKVIS